jgi:hypothetical protein
MSGIEIVGLVFGVLPVLIEVVKSYSTVADGLHSLRHYSKEVKSISLQTGVQNGIFLNHCRLLLRLVEDEKVVEGMLEDRSDRRWTSKELNDRLNAVLKDSFELCHSIIEQTKDSIEEMKEEMGKFDVLKDRKQQVCASLTLSTLDIAHSLTPGRANRLKVLSSDCGEPSKLLSTSPSTRSALATCVIGTMI